MKCTITIELVGPEQAVNDASKAVLTAAREAALKLLPSGFSFTTDDVDEADPELARYRAYAQGYLHRDGDLEFDDNAVVSKGEDAGAYVQGWKWVDDLDLQDEEDDAEEE